MKIERKELGNGKSALIGTRENINVLMIEAVVGSFVITYGMCRLAGAAVDGVFKGVKAAVKKEEERKRKFEEECKRQREERERILNEIERRKAATVK